MSPTRMSPTEIRASEMNGGSERRILLIEDSDVLSRRLVELLSEPGRLAVAAKAATQSEAVTRLKEAPTMCSSSTSSSPKAMGWP